MSNNCSLSTPAQPQSARDLFNQLIQNNLHIIETRLTCLYRRIDAISAAGASLKESFTAISDVMAAPFLRLGRKYRESPITAQVTAAAREFNNELAFAKLQASERIRALSAVENLPTPIRRSIERLGLRLSVIKLDIEDLIAADEADQAGGEAKQSQAETTAKAPPMAAVTRSQSTTTQDLDAAIKAPKPEPAPEPAPQPQAQTPRRPNPFGLPRNPENMKRNRFKKRVA